MVEVVVVDVDGNGTRLPVDPVFPDLPDFVLDEGRPGVGGRLGGGGRLPWLFPSLLFDDLLLAVVGPAAFLSTKNFGSKPISSVSLPFLRTTTVSSMKFRDCFTSLISKPISVASGPGIRTRVRSLMFMTSTSVLPTYLLTATRIQSPRSPGTSSSSTGGGGSVIADLR